MNLHNKIKIFANNNISKGAHPHQIFKIIFLIQRTTTHLYSVSPLFYFYLYLYFCTFGAATMGKSSGTQIFLKIGNSISAATLFLERAGTVTFLSSDSFFFHITSLHP